MVISISCIFLVHLSRRLKCTIVIMRCPSVRPSSVVVNFLHFWLLLWNHWTEFDETLQEGRSQRPLPSLCFSGRSEKQDGRPGLWLAEKFSTSSLKPLNGIQQNLTGSKISTSSTKFVFFGPIGKTRWPPWPLIGWDISDFSSETAEQNSTKFDRKQYLNVLYQVCIFRADRKNKMAALASDWLRHFRLLLWNRWMEFNETWQEARSQRPLPSLCFSGRSEKQDGRPGLWLAETFSTSPLKPLNGIQRNLTGSKISTSSTKFVFSGRSEKQDGRPDLWLAETFSTSPLKPLNGIQRNLTGSKISNVLYQVFFFFGPIGKTRWRPRPLIGWDIFDFSSETAEQNSTKLDRKQDLNVLFQVCVFGPMGKTRWLPWPICQKGGTLYSGARYVALLASCYFSVYSGLETYACKLAKCQLKFSFASWKYWHSTKVASSICFSKRQKKTESSTSEHRLAVYYLHLLSPAFVKAWGH